MNGTPTGMSEYYHENVALHQPERKMRQNAVMTYISYNYVSNNSCLCYKTEEVCDNLYLKFKKDTKQKYRKIHSILTY
jgi:hypothetical protein